MITRGALSGLMALTLSLTVPAACGVSAGEEQPAVESVAAAASQPDVLTLTSSGTIAARRTNLINFVWGQSTLPTTAAASEPVTAICATSGLPNLQSTTQLRISMSLGQEAFACHLRPSQSNGRLVIVHHGHECAIQDQSSPFDDDNEYGMFRTTHHLLNDGFGVLHVYMPRMRPGDCPSSPDPHPAIMNLQPPSGTGSSLQYFLSGTLQALNQVQSLGIYQEVNMVGLSGGGWTASWYAALDTRVKASFVMSGAMPFQFWIRDPAADEQGHHPYYDNRTGYRDLFIMGAHGSGRRQVHVLRRNDTCCFNASWNLPTGAWADNVHAYETEIRTALVNMGDFGMFRLEIDDTNQASHTLSRNGVTNVILAELEGARRHIAAPDDGQSYVRAGNGNLWRNSGGVWKDTGLPMVGVPAAIRVPGTGQHSVDVFYRDRENRLMRAFPNASDVWTSTSMGGIIISDPAVVSRGAGLWDVVAFGGDYRLYRWSSTFAGFQSTVPGAMGLGTPTLITGLTTPSNVLEIYFRGLGDGVFALSWNGSTWSRDSSLQPGAILGFPTAVPDANGTTRVFAIGHDNQLYVNQRTGGNPWSGWQSLSAATGSTGTKLVGSPSAHPTNLSVSVRSGLGNLIIFARPASDWTFANAGGGIVGSPTRVATGTYVRAPANNLWFHGAQGWIPGNGWFE